MMKKKSSLLLFAVLILVILSAGKYCSSGEQYTFETDASDEIIFIEQGSRLSQQVFIDKKSKWNADSYGVKFNFGASWSAGGKLKFEISQNGNAGQQYTADWKDIQMPDGWYVFPGFDYSTLEKGDAVITIEAVRGSAGIYAAENHYNLPDCTLDGADTGRTLVQRYIVPYVNEEYILRVVLYTVLILLLFGMGCIVVMCEETKQICRMVQTGLVLSFLIFLYLYGSLFYLEPTWCEAVTDFMHAAYTEGFWKNLTLPDAGYLPLLQRTISVLLIKVLHIKAYHALYIMQIAAYVISGYILSFFCKKNFSAYMDLKWRFAASLILMIQVSGLVTLTFICFVPYGIYMMLLFFIADSREWSKTEYTGIVIWSCFFCLSKGQYVVVLPFMMVSLILFKKSFNRRDMIYMSCTAAASAVQFLYSFLYSDGEGAGWIDKAGDASQPHYLLRLICEWVRDIPNDFLLVFEKNVPCFNGISVLIIAGFWTAVFVFFISRILMKYVKKEPMDEDVKNLGILFIFLCGQALFFRISVFGTSQNRISSDEFWNFNVMYIGGRYEVFAYLPVWISYIILFKMLRKKCTYVKQEAVMVFVLCALMSNTRLQLKGIGTDDYSTNREYASGVYSEACLLKNIENIDSRIVPIRTTGWLYVKNARLYCMGTDILAFNLKPEMISDESVRNGKVYLHDKANINEDCGIWQVFIKKINLIDNCKYRLRMTDKNGNIIKETEQDNSEYQKIVSFSFEEAVYGADGIQILNERGEDVRMEDGMYLVSSGQESLLKE